IDAFPDLAAGVQRFEVLYVLMQILIACLAHRVLEMAAELVGGAPHLPRSAAEIVQHLRQLLRAYENQCGHRDQKKLRPCNIEHRKSVALLCAQRAPACLKLGCRFRRACQTPSSSAHGRAASAWFGLGGAQPGSRPRTSPS